MEPRWCQDIEAARLLVHLRNDRLVSLPRPVNNPHLSRNETCRIFIPWFTVRKVPVEVEIPSPKVAIIRFERGLQQGLLARISRSSILEYHAFGTVSEGKHAKYHYLICGVQGDFTRGLVNNPPTHLWTRELKVCDLFIQDMMALVMRLGSSSLPEYRIRPLSTNVAFESALAPVLVALSRPVSRMMAGS